MPIFKLNEETYNIPDNIVDQFQKDNPKAVKTKEPGKTSPTTPGAVVEEIAAPELTPTESQSVDISLELPETVKTGTSAQTEFILDPISDKELDEIENNYIEVGNINVEKENKNKKESKLKRFQQGKFKLEEKDEFDYWKNSNGKLFETSEVLSNEEINKKQQAKRTAFLADLPSYKRQSLYNRKSNLYNEELEKYNIDLANFNNESNQIQQSIDSFNLNKNYSKEDVLNLKDKIEDLKITHQNLQKLSKNLNDKNTLNILDDFKRDYSKITLLENRFKTLAVDLAVGPMAALDILKSEEGRKKSYTNDLIDYREELAEEAEQDLAKPIEVESISDWNTFGTWAADGLVNFIPSGLMASTGAAAMPLFFASGFGSKMSDFALGKRKAIKSIPALEEAIKNEKDLKTKNQLQKQLDLQYNYLNVSDLTRLGTAALYGTAEFVFEIPTIRAIRDISNVSELIAKNGFKKALVKSVAAYPAGVGMESASEGLTTLTQNIADIHIFGDKTKSYLDGVSEAAAQGALIGNGFKTINVGVVAQAAVRDVIATKSDKSIIKKRVDKINSLAAQLTNKNLTPQEKRALQKEINNEIKDLKDDQDISSARFLRLNGEQQQEVFEYDRLSRKEIERWSEIASSKNIDEATKESLRQEIVEKINGYQSDKQSLLNSSDGRLKPYKKIEGDKELVTGDRERNLLIVEKEIALVEQHNKTTKAFNKIDFKELGKGTEALWDVDTNTITINTNSLGSNPHVVLHEYTHAIISKKGFEQEEFDAIKEEVLKEFKTRKDNGEFTEQQYNNVLAKYNLYKNSKDQSEELLTAIGEQIASNEIKKSDESFLNNLAYKIKQALSKIVGSEEVDNFRIDNAQNAFNFINQLTKSVYSKRKLNVATGGDPEKKTSEKKESKISGENIQKIFDEKGKDGAFEIIEAYKPLTTRLTNKYRDVPGFDFELLQSEIEIAKRGLLDLINAYDPSKGATLNTYIQGQLPNRAIEAANRILDTEFKLDVTEAKGVTDTTTEETIEAPEQAEIADEIKSLRKEIGLPEELINTVKEAVIKTFGTRLPNPQDPKFRIELQKRFRTELKKPMAKFAGKQEAYESFLRDNFEAIYNKLPQSLINRRFKDFQEPVLDKNGKHVREQTAEGNKVYTKKKISKAEFIKYFLGSDVGRSTQGTRKTAIVEAVAEEIAFDATMEVIQNPDVINKYQEIAEITGEVLPDNFKSVIAKQIDRAENFKFSKSLPNVAKEEYNLEQQELARILDKNNLNSLSNKYSLLSDNIIYEADPANIKFSLTTKAEGKWEQNQLNPLDESRAIYKFKVGEIDYEINTFKDPLNYNYDIFEQTEDIEDGAINSDPKSWGMTFAAAATQRVSITGYGLKGRTNQFKVFGTVANATIDLIKKEKLNSITFTAKEESRKRLYNSLNQKFANELGWETYNYQANIPDGSETIFIAYNPKAFNTGLQITNPPPIKFSLSTNNKFNVTAKNLLDNPKAWAEFSNNMLNRSQTYQNNIGSIETRLGSVRPSNVIDYAGVTNYKKLTDTEKEIFKQKIEQLQEKIIAQKTKNTINMLQDGPAYKSPPKAFGKNASEFLNKIKDGEIFKHTKQYQRIYRDMWSKYFDMLAADNTMYDFLELTLNNSNTDTSHWHRQGALFIGFDQGALPVPLLDKNGKQIFRFTKEGKKYPLTRVVEFEHAVQNHIQWNRVLKAAAKFAKKNDKKGFIEYLENSMKDYVMIGVAYMDARKVDKAGFAHIMPKKWKRWWDRYFNPKVAAIDGGINPNDISFIEYSDAKAKIKGNIAEQFNLVNEKGAQVKQSKSLSRQFEEKILQKTTGVSYLTKFSPVEARIMAKGKGKQLFIPYSADDFVGLLYATLGTKDQGGNEQMEWYKENLLRPFSRGIQQYEASKQKALRDWTALKKEAQKDVPGGLDKRNETGLTNQDAVRIYIWTKQGDDIPGIERSPKLVEKNLKIVNSNEELKAFAERLISLNPEGYPKPGKNWDSGDITTDIVSYIDGPRRAEFLTEWKQRADIIFNENNIEKLRALYGERYVDALQNILERMYTGKNRRQGLSKIEQRFMDWTNNSVGAIMFFNARSAVLQTLSAVNFINFSDNNPINAGIAFANQKQYWNDFSTLFNSDFLKQRRSGLQTDINADEIARAAKGAKNTARAALSAILKFGFTPTQIADSFAIASGGATFYRNRINKYKKEGLTQAEAETKAFTDFQEVAEETQQSARPDRISSEQAGSLGRLILAFGNTPMQYARLTKKATLDLINGRGDWKTNISKIAYYSVIQNIIFSALQQGLFALLFDDEDDEKEQSRLFRIGNSSLDTFMRGSGVYGAAAATVKNIILEIIEQSKKSRPDYTQIAIEATSLSPPINSKLRKLESAGKVFTYKQSREKVFTEGFSLENPAFLAAGKVISAGTNLPADRIVQKADHIKTAMESETELWQSIALSLGWSEWDLNMIERQTKKSKDPAKIIRRIERKLNKY